LFTSCAHSSPAPHILQHFPKAHGSAWLHTCTAQINSYFIPTNAIPPRTTDIAVLNTNSQDLEAILWEHPVNEPVLVTNRQKKTAEAQRSGSWAKRGGRYSNHGERFVLGSAGVMEVVWRGEVGRTIEEMFWRSWRMGWGSAMVSLFHLSSRSSLLSL
jgi:hypothetical protein